MHDTQRLRIAGWCGIIGGILWFLQSILTDVLFPQLAAPGTPGFTIGGAIATVNLVVLLVGFLGVAWGRALGGWFGKIAFGVAVLGYVLMIVGGLLTIVGAGPLADPEAPISLIYLLGRLITVVFTFFTGIAVLTARRGRGGRDSRRCSWVSSQSLANSCRCSWQVARMRS